MSHQSNEQKRSVDHSLSAIKMLTILEYLAENRFPVRLQDIAERIDLSQPSILRYLNSLVSNNYVYQEENTSRYALTWKIKRLGVYADTALSLRNIVSPFLNMLSNMFNVGSGLVKDQNLKSIYLDYIEKPGGSLSLLRIGKEAPLYATASGKIILSGFSEWQLDDFVNNTELEKVTENTITDKNALLEEISLVRSHGYTIDNEECERNIRGLAVPLYDYTDKICAAITVFDVSENMPDERILQDILPVLKEISQKISIRMGCNLSYQ
jgi:DNA-binding IclR family transcriptional regulator